MAKKKDKVAKPRDYSKVEERAKQIAAIKTPDRTEFQNDNDNQIDSYLRNSRFNKVKTFKSIKEKNRKRY